MEIVTVGTPALYAGFVAFVIGMLALDLGVFHRKAHAISVREALIWSLVWVALSGVFGAFIYLHFGKDPGLEFITGYLIEKALAVDNIFIIAVIFGYFAVPLPYQHRVLFWGIFGALVMRAVFIALGAALLARFHWILYVFGGILIITAIRLVVQKDSESDPGNLAVVRWFRRLVPMTATFHDQKLVVREGGRLLATPLLLVLVVVEVTDLIFALDSIPAIFAVTRDPFIVFTSNIFAILGLRSMYFLLAGVIDKFRFLKLGLALVLGFVGLKMLLADVYKIPIGFSLLAVALLIGGSIVFSLLIPPRPGSRPPKPPTTPDAPSSSRHLHVP